MNAPPPAGAPRPVVLLEDHPELREALEEALVDAGFQVVAVAETGAALAAVRQLGRPTLILLDQILADGVADALLSGLAREPHGDAQRVILMSGRAPVIDLGRYPAVVQFLQKPFSVEALLASVRTHAT